MSHWTPDFCFEQLKVHRDLIVAAAGRNEAATRLLAIDTILFDVLGWDKRDVDPEKYCRTVQLTKPDRTVGYIDYAMYANADLSMIIEAKKHDNSFVLPNVDVPTGLCRFGLLAKECQDADNALRQGIGYAASLGVRYVAISNGYQWLLALTYVPGQSVDERQVIVFESIDAIENRFRFFWESFSPAGLTNNLVQNRLLDLRKVPPPQKLSQRISAYPAPATRNNASEGLAIVLGAVWEDVKADEDETLFLKECYVVPKANTSALALAKELLERKNRSDESVASQAVQVNEVSKFLTEYTPEKPIVVLGNVGNGKSTFLRYLRQVEAVETLARYIQLDIDFIDSPSSDKEVPDYIYSQIEARLQQPPFNLDIMDDALIRAALNADINRFRKTPEAKAYPQGSPEYIAAELAFLTLIRANKHEFFKRLFVHLRGSRRFSLAVFIDNLDRRGKEIQEEAYLRASAIARDWACLVFVCLRPTTYYKSSRDGVLDSVAPHVIAVTSGKADHVLARRLKFAKRYAQGQPISSEGPGTASGEVYVQFGNAHCSNRNRLFY